LHFFTFNDSNDRYPALYQPGRANATHRPGYDEPPFSSRHRRDRISSIPRFRPLWAPFHPAGGSAAGRL
jgi:hypothetical protein